MAMRRMAAASAALFTLLGAFGLAYAAGDVAAGKAKAAACAGCHGMSGEGIGSNPPLAGKSEGEIVTALQDEKSGKRADAVMQSVASILSEEDMANLGAYYASLAK